jgi:hypothetical protein
MNTRRDALKAMLFGAGYVGLRALATGLPASFLLNPRKALANMSSCGAASGPATGCSSAAQYFILSTSGQGDPINANVPGMYENSSIVHPPSQLMAPTKFTMGGQSFTAAKPWSQLDQSVLDRMTFWHLMTNTFVHPAEQEVLRLMDVTAGPEMLPSILGKVMQPCLSTIQAQPVCMSEDLTFNGQALPIIPPTALRATLTNPAGPFTSLQPLRDKTMNKLYGLYRDATPAQQAYVDSLVTSQCQAREISQQLLNKLSSITDDSVQSQITAAVTLIQMQVSPVISIKIPFGADNHSDPGLQNETLQTTGTDPTLGLTGVPAIAALMAALDGAKFANGTPLNNKVTFMSLNVFGRTLTSNGGSGTAADTGRGHWAYHQVSITIGSGFKAGVVGGVMPYKNDVGCTNIDPSTGLSSSSGSVSAQDTLAAFGQTILSSVGVPTETITNTTNGLIPLGNNIITGALAT